MSMRLNFFTPTKKPVGYDTGTDGRRTRLYDKPRTPWRAYRNPALLAARQTRTVQARIAGINPADLTRRINQIQLRLIEVSRGKTKAMAANRHLDMTPLEPSIRRLQTTQ
ncbi:transposase [Ornithinimicrobium sp. INDO-MA30-4]|uniref:transposase n=1 Tax=Ornithinimicrobium sp. INDO-MA30-4 TaxID=2908651 RepID=UPI001F22F3F1|nr:transposase [Ornithinimicrobium sp. INDO-MA30-4]UJH70896.1 transposase [Ornithinimicrobium sp. INDO-MA30-4]